MLETNNFLDPTSLSYRKKRGWDKSPSLSIVFELSSKTQWLSGLYCAEVGRRNRILTNYRFLSHSHFFSDEDELELLELESSLEEDELNCSGWSSL